MSENPLKRTQMTRITQIFLANHLKNHVNLRYR